MRIIVENPKINSIILELLFSNYYWFKLSQKTLNIYRSPVLLKIIVRNRCLVSGVYDRIIFCYEFYTGPSGTILLTIRIQTKVYDQYLVETYRRFKSLEFIVRINIYTPPLIIKVCCHYRVVTQEQE